MVLAGSFKSSWSPRNGILYAGGIVGVSQITDGLKTSSNTFQRILNTIFSDFLYQFVIIYVDDIICWSDSQEQALKHYEKILRRASDYDVQLKPTKCKPFATTVDILGHQITPDGRRPTSKGIEAIINLPSPKNTTELKKFLGMVGFLREYIRNMSARTLHLRSLLNKGVRFQWDEVHEAEFNDLKQAITSPDILLSHPRFDLEFEIHTDASRIGMGGVTQMRLA